MRRSITVPNARGTEGVTRTQRREPDASKTDFERKTGSEEGSKGGCHFPPLPRLEGRARSIGPTGVTVSALQDRRSPYLTVEEVAAHLRVNSKTVRKAIANGQIVAVRIGRTIRVHERMLDLLGTQIRVVPPEG